MIKFDMWYGDKHTEADKIDIAFYPQGFYTDGSEYRGNIYRAEKCIGDYVCTDCEELEKAFPQLAFNWD